jgi:UDP-glucose 4-epimerase
VILRYANVFGPRQQPKGEAGVVSIFISNLIKKNKSFLFHYPQNKNGMIRDYVYVKDVVSANVKALTYTLNDTFNIGTGKETLTRELYLIISKFMNENIELVEAEARLGDIKRSCLNVEKAKKILGWQPEYPLKKGIKETIEFFKINKWRKDGRF